LHDFIAIGKSIVVSVAGLTSRPEAATGTPGRRLDFGQNTVMPVEPIWGLLNE
jgi:hypothetical protein